MSIEEKKQIIFDLYPEYKHQEFEIVRLEEFKKGNVSQSH